MAITGGIKFFDKNKADSLTGAMAIASSGNPSAGFILDRSNFTVWRSVGSDDTTTETITITLPTSQTFNRLFLLRHNFKEFTVKFFDGFSFVDFVNVVGINGITTSGISETVYALGSSYYEFDSVTTTQIEITVTKTQVVNEEKFLNSFVVTPELGTLVGFPIIKNVTKDRNLRKSTLLNGRVFVDKSIEVMRFLIDFKNYPPLLTLDLDLLVTLFDRDDNFLVWLSGGRDGIPFFKRQLVGFRIEDLIQVQVVNVFKDSYRKNTYVSMVNQKLNLEEAS